jgi:hypothetical protein
VVTDPTVDFQRPARLVARQGHALGAYVTEEVWPWSRGDRARLERAGLGRRGLRSPVDLRRLEPVRVEEMGDGRAFTLRPEPDRMSTLAPLPLRARWVWADLLGRRSRLVAEELDPRFKPVLWLRQGPLLVGYTSADLERLGDLGRRWLAAAGIRADDRLVLLGGIADELVPWQVWLGARAGGVATTLVRDPADPSSAALAPTALAGPLTGLVELARRSPPIEHLRTVLVTDALPTAAQRAGLRDLAGRPDTVAVCGVLAPAGVRAAWGQCRGGQVHTWPDAEVLEVLDPLTGAPAPPGEDGELTWSPIRWRGTTALRLATGVFGHLEVGPCPCCRRTTPRVVVLEVEPPFATVLDGHPDVVDWWAETAQEPLLVEVALRRGAGTGVVASLAGELGARVERVPPARIRRRRAAGGTRVVERSR